MTTHRNVLASRPALRLVEGLADPRADRTLGPGELPGLLRSIARGLARGLDRDPRADEVLRAAIAELYGLAYRLQAAAEPDAVA